MGVDTNFNAAVIAAGRLNDNSGPGLNGRNDSDGGDSDAGRKVSVLCRYIYIYIYIGYSWCIDRV